ncbi:histidine kinase [Thalassotalea atypica]|uniref:histidine kinase n=1 Tax=Thalassotalea atypica TaxID=2054316 RepID=UPI0025737AA7|nr:histidine kinase [Thalassotalea atypica]
MDPFIKLTAKLTNPAIQVEDKLKEICIVTSQLIQGADRVSLWVFSGEFDRIESLICFDRVNGSFESGAILSKSDFNDYFNGILNQKVINAPDARAHELTKCFNEAYFEPLDIQSLLDFVLHQDFIASGVICCESVGKITYWSDENIESLKRIARVSSMYFKIGSEP